jgi:hypothetical protein
VRGETEGTEWNLESNVVTASTFVSYGHSEHSSLLYVLLSGRIASSFLENSLAFCVIYSPGIRNIRMQVKGEKECGQDASGCALFAQHCGLG